jgi:hypothetical protein
LCGGGGEEDGAVKNGSTLEKEGGSAVFTGILGEFMLPFSRYTWYTVTCMQFDLRVEGDKII